MSNRDIWRHGSGRQLHDLIASACAVLLLVRDDSHVYFSSPWMSDFMLLGNQFREFGAAIPELTDLNQISFAQYLSALSKRRPVRLVTTNTDTSKTFIGKEEVAEAAGIKIKMASDNYHEKGILAPSFYIEGSMNITYQGVYVNGEKITYHANDDEQGADKIARAYLEFDRLWESLS